MKSSAFGIFTAGTLPLFPAFVMQSSKPTVSVEDWMTQALQRNVRGTLQISRFVEPIYYLLAPITWEPNPGQLDYPIVTVPAGFVTDLASIPRVFWSLLRPDGEYTYPAIVHDYLYWTQSGPRNVADTILKFGMQDFKVGTATIDTIYQAVRIGGENSWDRNAKLKLAGERRTLKRFPSDPRIRWADWKKDERNFVA